MEDSRPCRGSHVPPFYVMYVSWISVCYHASFVMLLTTQSDAVDRRGVSLYFSGSCFPNFLYTDCISVYLV